MGDWLTLSLSPWSILFGEGVFPGGKGGRCVMLTTLLPSYAVVMKSGNLKFLEPSGPFQACKGNALPFYHLLMHVQPSSFTASIT